MTGSPSSTGTVYSVQTIRQRAGWIVSALGLASLILLGRLVQLQAITRVTLEDRAERQRLFYEEISPRPGDIHDRQGRLLATSVQTRSLYVVPSKITKPWSLAEQLATALDISEDDLFLRFHEHRDKHFLWIARRLDEAVADRVQQLKLPEEMWGFRREYRRDYPQGPLAAQVLGLRDVDGKGQGGIEESCEGQLAGASGRRILSRDARGMVIGVVNDVEQTPRDGQPVTLALDAVIQLFVERELDKLMTDWKPESTCAIVVDPRQGDILAMASRPSFDPNAPEHILPNAWKNRAIADIYEPGSTFKPFIVGYGLDRGLIRRDDQFNCESGQYRMGRRLLHDHHRYGVLSLTDVLVKSSNIGMAKIGERLTNEGLFEAALMFGFGRKTGIELPGELPGILRPLSQWTSYSTGSIPMGHEIATTPLQLITAHAAIANGGQLIRPRLLLPTLSDSTATEPRRIVQDTVSRETARWLIEVPMHEVVTRGTGRKAKVEGYELFGKTGTAQALSPNGGYRSGKYIASFVCGAPVQNPRLLVLVVVNEASTGGETFGGRIAAPAAAEMLRQSLLYLRIPPTEGAPQLLQLDKPPLQ